MHCVRAGAPLQIPAVPDTAALEPQAQAQADNRSPHRPTKKVCFVLLLAGIKLTGCTGKVLPTNCLQRKRRSAEGSLAGMVNRLLASVLDPYHLTHPTPSLLYQQTVLPQGLRRPNVEYKMGRLPCAAGVMRTHSGNVGGQRHQMQARRAIATTAIFDDE